MKPSLLVFFVVLGGCTVLTDFSDSPSGSNTNNTSNINNVNNTTGPEVCDNGRDDDNDGFVDCKDSDCYETASCECRLDNAFFDNPDPCPDGQACVIKLTSEGGEPVCLPAARVDGGTYYEDCGAGGECPFGSYCTTNVYAGGNECQPWCSPGHVECPDGGFCAYFDEEEAPEDTLKVCFRSDECYPPDPSSCPSGQGCYLLSEQGGTLCLESGTSAVGTVCTSFQGCSPGFVCLGAEDGEGVCLKWCDTAAEEPCAGIMGSSDLQCMPLGGTIGVCVSL